MLSKELNEHIDRSSPSQSESELYGERTKLVIANDTGRDIHIQVKCDVHTGNWGPHQVNHTEEPQLKSRKISEGNEATYCIEIWKNDNGQRGESIGTFDHQVRYNLGGNYDRLELIIVDINGQTHLRAFSVRKAVEVALLLWIGE